MVMFKKKANANNISDMAVGVDDNGFVVYGIPDARCWNHL